jgi:Lar family restriction alleviation protein
LLSFRVGKIVSEELKPCPFCGGAAHIEQRGTPRQSCIVECGSCGLRHDSGDEGDMCGMSWNRRTASADARKDAARYRYLRNCGVIVDFTRSGPWKFTDDVDAAIDKYLERRAAIDEATLAAKEKP